MANDIIVSEMTSASQINTNDLMIMTQPDLQAETGYSTKKGTVLQVANKMLKGTEYLTDLPDFTDKTVLGGLEELKGDLTALLPVNTASGAIANFDTDLSLPLVDCKANIVASQPSGTPTPSSPLAISGYTGMNLTRCGSNLWDEEWEVGTINDTTGVPTSSTTQIRSKNFSHCQGGQTYYIKVGSNNDIRVFWYDSEQNYLSQTNNIKNATAQAPAKASLFKLRGTNSYGTTYNNDISINYPATDTSYHAYNGTTYPVSWQTEAGTVYGGNLDLTTGVLTVTYKQVDLGDLEYDATGSLTSHYVTLSDAKNDNGISALCDIYTNHGAISSWGELGVDEFVIRYQTFRVYDDTGDTAANFKTRMEGHKLVYELATPVTYQLTPVQINALLGVNNVFNDTNGDTEVKYKEGIQHYIDKKIAATQALIL